MCPPPPRPCEGTDSQTDDEGTDEGTDYRPRLPAVRGKSLDPRRISHSFTTQGGRPHADSPLIEFNLKKSTGSSRKSEHVARHEAKRLVYKIFKVLGQRSPFWVKIPLPPIIWLLMALDKKLTSGVFLLSRRTPFDSFLFSTFGWTIVVSQNQNCIFRTYWVVDLR